MNYSKVQFISWEIYTGPTITHSYGDRRSGGYYNGLVKYSQNDRRTDIFSQYQDIKARVQFTHKAIIAARYHPKIDHGSHVLKIFMAPEFLYRGAGGAYLHDLIDGWEGGLPHGLLPSRWKGLFGELKNIVINNNFENWLFVFGTAISASFKTSNNGGNLNLDDIAEIYNSSLIQLGGTENGAKNYVSRKHYVSGIDFLDFYKGQPAHVMGSITPADPEDIIPSDVLGVTEGGALFNITTEGGAAFIIKDVNDHNGNSIKFGIEICLDHACSGGNGTNKYGRLKTAGQRVRIQLVPSAGMEIQRDSLALETFNNTSYAFNCDGLTPHTQIYDQDIESLGMSLLDFRYANKHQSIKVDRFSSYIRDTCLWTYGSGSVRIVDPLPIN